MTSGETVTATVSERDAAQDVVDAIAWFLRTVRTDRNVPDKERVPLAPADLNDVSQAVIYFRQVAEQGVLDDGF